MKTLSILIPLPHRDFDPTEVGVSWQIIHQAGINIDFSTPDGNRAYADPIMISGEGLDPWGFIPGLKKIKLIGLLLRANHSARIAYRELEKDQGFLNPIRYDQIDITQYDGLLLPGGHAQGMHDYLENKILQDHVANFFEQKLKNGKNKPVAAICHGVVLAARSISKATGKSSLYGLKTTALPWAFEKKAWNTCQYFCRFWDPDYYRTYTENSGEPAGYASVEQEVTRILASSYDFLNVTKNSSHYFKKNSGLFRDNLNDDSAAWLVKDRHYLSARWPGDVYSFAKSFVQLLRESSAE